MALVTAPASAAVLQSANFISPLENYNSAGSTAAASANFQTFADGVDVIGLAASSDFSDCSGFACALYGGPLVAASSGTATIGSSGGTIAYNPAPGPVTITIPAGAYVSTITVAITTPASFSCNAGPVENLVPIVQTGGVGIDVEVSQEPQKSVVVAISYENSTLQSGLDPGQFVIARCDTSRDVWVPLPSDVDELGRQVTAESDHLSLFQVMAGAAPASLSQFKAWPDPLRPSVGETQMNFLAPANSRIRIYTLSGLLVKDLSAASDGTAVWDGTNQSGRPVASGVYFVFAQGAGQEKTLKVAVQR
ncbi:MAG TPA: hypothetical protein VNK24_05900 [Elusimicrobiota bacterium]|nr:hypothetical protein [Elusimicrobiota bacterium]